jgi:hypothetical protein
MTESIKQRIGDVHRAQDAEKVLTAMLADLTAIRSSFLLLTAKLDADIGVTDANYAALTNPATLTTLS